MPRTLRSRPQEAEPIAKKTSPARESVKVSRGVDPRYLQSVLTKDITTLECIYDLIDNAIDAARDRILADKKGRTDEYGLPADYSGYRVDLSFEPDAFVIADNCGGMDEQTLTQRAFVTGTPSTHPYGIGWFGIGLKRALMRLGRNYEIRSDTGKFAAHLKFGAEEFGLEDGDLIAQVVASRGAPGTSIRVESLNAGIRHEFGGSWRANVPKSLSRRYGLYVAKGLVIRVDEAPVDVFGPGLRREGPVPTHSKHISIDGVDVFIDSGMHEAYRIKGEPGWTRDTELTDQYGWYFVCNDRIIRVAAREGDIGFAVSWHQEYYGFVGWVRFVAEDAEHLPWDTKKSAIDVSSGVFQAIKGQLQGFADAYRTEQRKARNTKEEGEKGSGDKASDKGGKGQKGSKGGRGGKSDPQDHNENWRTLLPANLDASLDHPKVRALVHEAKELDVSRCYAASMLFRATMEAALLERLKKSRRYKEVRDLQFEKQALAGRPFTEEQKKNFKPTLLHMMEWLNKNDDYFPDEVRRECVTARNKFARHMKELNGVVHEGDLTNSGKLKIVRDETLPLLRFLLSPIDS